MRNELVVFIMIIIAALTDVDQDVRLPQKVTKQNNENNKHTQTDRLTDTGTQTLKH